MKDEDKTKEQLLAELKELRQTSLGADSSFSRNTELIRMALEKAGTGTWDWDVTSGIVEYDDYWKRKLGYDPEEFKFSFDWWEKSIHPDSRPIFEKALSDYVEGIKEYYELEYQLKKKSGEWMWVWAIGKCLEWDDQKSPLRVVGIHRDITERKQAEDQLRFQANLLENVSDAIIGTDLKRTTIW